jgi:hypothetical protein
MAATHTRVSLRWPGFFLSNTAAECVELLGIFMLDRSLAFRLKTRTVGCLRGRDSSQIELVHDERERPSSFARALLLSNTAKDVRIYEVRPRKDRRGFDLISMRCHSGGAGIVIAFSLRMRRTASSLFHQQVLLDLEMRPA